MTSVNDKVSIILPVYNAEKYLCNTINSIIDQTYTNLEIIVINDCSTDNSHGILQLYQKLDERISVINLVENSGVAYARNIGIDKSTGRYLAFIDSDDIWKPNKIYTQIEDCRKNNIGFSYTGIEIINDEGILIKKKRKVRRTVDYKYLLRNTIIATSSVMIDKSLINEFRMPLMRSGQDYATWLSILRKGVLAFGINEALVQYRIASNSLSKNKFKSIQQVWYIQKELENINITKRIFNIIFLLANVIIKKIL